MPPPHPVHRSAVLAVAVLTAWLGGCAKKPLPIVKADPSEVEYAGCYEVQREGPTCYVGKREESRRLTLHPNVQANEFQVWADAKRVVAKQAETDAGSILWLSVPSGATSIEVRAISLENIRVWTLRVADFPKIPEWMDRTWTLVEEGPKGVAAARELLLQEVDRTEGVIPKLLVLARLAELEPDTGDRRNRHARFMKAIDAHRRAGLLQGEARLATQEAFALVEQHDFAAARELLESSTSAPEAPAEARQLLSYFKGLLARRSGDFRTAIGRLQQTAELATRFDHRKMVHDAQQEEALTLTDLGRFRDAEALLGRLAAEQDVRSDPCDRAITQTNRGWNRYLGLEAGEWDLGDPVAPLAEGRKLYLANPHCPLQRQTLFNVSLNLALAHLQAERLPEARALLKEILRSVDNSGLLQRMWLLDLQARIALKGGQASTALRLYEDLSRIAAATISRENQWRALFGQATALNALGRPENASLLLAQAERLVDQQVAQIPLEGGRETFVDQWSSASRLHVEVLLKIGNIEQALEVARHARARALQQIANSARLESSTPEERRDRAHWLSLYWQAREQLDRVSAQMWSLPKAAAKGAEPSLAQKLRDAQVALDQAVGRFRGPEPPPGEIERLRPPPGELLLAYFPLPSSGKWVGFGDDGTKVTAHELELPAGSLTGSNAAKALSNVLLGPFQQEIARARKIIVLPYGRLRTVDFHVLPFGGGESILLTQRSVVYGLDLSTRTSTPENATPLAVVVADSHGDLPEARKEGRDVQQALANHPSPWKTTLMEGNQAKAESLRQAIETGIDLLHYAGHADFSGRGGWESQLPLASQSHLTLGDILALSKQPRWVILSGCETGASDDTTQVESQGLAHAFLLGGSNAVVAATRKVNDKVAHDLVLEIYRNMGTTPNLAVLLQQAQNTLRARGVSPREWASFRVFEP